MPDSFAEYRVISALVFGGFRRFTEMSHSCSDDSVKILNVINSGSVMLLHFIFQSRCPYLNSIFFLTSFGFLAPTVFPEQFAKLRNRRSHLHKVKQNQITKSV